MLTFNNINEVVEFCRNELPYVKKREILKMSLKPRPRIKCETVDGELVGMFYSIKDMCFELGFSPQSIEQINRSKEVKGKYLITRIDK